LRYRLHQDTYIGDRLIVAGEGGTEMEIPPLARAGEMVTKMVSASVPMSSQIVPSAKKVSVRLDHDLHHIPGPHWEPLDDEAKAHCKKVGHEFTGEMPDVLDGLEEHLANAQARMRPDDVAMIAAGVITALQTAGLLTSSQPKK
jgi:hypothetical protein